MEPSICDSTSDPIRRICDFKFRKLLIDVALHPHLLVLTPLTEPAGHVLFGQFVRKDLRKVFFGPVILHQFGLRT